MFFITDAYAQTGGAAGGPDGMTAIIMNLLPMVAIVGVFYFLMIRPQQQARKAHMALLASIVKNDTVVTSGGIIGKVKSVADDELRIEIAPNVDIRVERGAISTVRNRTQPAPANDTKPAKTNE
jgi:preprotein translocase subunit YajC